MKFGQFVKFEPRTPAHVYVFVCGDDYLVDQSYPVWQRVFGGDWVFERLSVKEFEATDGRDLLEAALSPPLFGPSRALLVSDAGKITRKSLAVVEEISRLGASSLKLVLLAKSTRELGRKGGEFQTVEIDALRPADAAGWLCRHYGVRPEVAGYLVETVGSDLRPLAAEMEKLAAYVRGSRPVELSDVDLLTLRTEQFSPFELDDAVAAGKHGRAVRVAGGMLEEGVEPLIILSRVARVWRQLLIGKALARTASPRDIAAAASVPHWKAEGFSRACERIAWPRVLGGFAELVAADRRFKTGASEPALVLDLLLWRLLAPDGGTVRQRPDSPAS